MLGPNFPIQSSTGQLLPQTPDTETDRRVGGLWGWWLRLTAPSGADRYQQPLTSPRQERERLRRAALTSAIAPFVALSPFLLSAQASVDPATMAAIVLLFVIVIASLIFNRTGLQTLAAIILIAGMDLVVEGALISAGQRTGLGAGWLLTFDLFVIPLISAGVLLSRRYLWLFAALHIGLILGDYYLLPHGPDLIALVKLWNGDSIAYARPILIQLGGAVLSFVSVRSTDQAIIRADRAEDLARIQQQVAEERSQLEHDARELLTTHVRIANGDFSARAPAARDRVIFNIAASLNNLITRFQRAAQAEHQLQRTDDELRRLAAAIDDANAGRPPIWPAPTGTSADLILERIAQRGRRAAPPQSLRPPTPVPPQPFAQSAYGVMPPQSMPPDALVQQPSFAPRPPYSGSLSHEGGWPALYPTQGDRMPVATDNPWILPTEEDR